ncbi:hypothetical protein ACLOJK_041838 [Asimina triloba]
MGCPMEVDEGTKIKAKFNSDLWNFQIVTWALFPSLFVLHWGPSHCSSLLGKKVGVYAKTRPFCSDFSQRPPSQPLANSQVGSAPFSAQPIPYNNFQATTKKMDIPNAKVGVIIGKGGETIKYLQLQSGARIQVTRDADADPYSQTRDVELIGTSEQVSRAEQLIKDVIAESDSGASGTAVARVPPLQPGTEQYTMRVPNNKVAMIIGKGGETIKSMQSKSGARIQVIPLHLPPGDTSTERTVYINGTKEQIDSAKELLNDIISDNRVRSAPTSVNYMQQGYRPPGSWAPSGQPPASQAPYGYAQPGTYPTPPPYYGAYPQQAGWDQAPASGAAPPPQQSAGYNYYAQQGQTGSAAPNVDYGYGQPAPGPSYAYDQGYSHQHQNYGPDGQQHDAQNLYVTPGNGQPSGTMPGKPEGTPSQASGTTTPPAQTVGAANSQPYGNQASTTPPPTAATSQPYGTPSMPPPAAPYGQQSAVSPAGYTGSQFYPAPSPAQSTYDQSSYNHMGYGGQQPAQIPPPTSQLGYGQHGYPPPSGYTQGTNPPVYGQPPVSPSAYGQAANPPAYGQPPISPTGYGQGANPPAYGQPPPVSPSGYSQSTNPPSYGQPPPQPQVQPTAHGPPQPLAYGTEKKADEKPPSVPQR